MGLLDSKVLKNSSYLKSQTLSTVKEEKDEDRFASSNRQQRFTDFKELEMSSSNEDIMLSKSPGVRGWRGGREDLLSRTAALEAESALLRNEILHQNMIIQDLKSEKTQMDRICNIVKKYLMRKKVFESSYVQSVQLLEYVIDFCQVHKFFYIDSGGHKTRQDAEKIIPEVQNLLERIQRGFGNLSELGMQLDTNDEIFSVLKDSREQATELGGLLKIKKSESDSKTSNMLSSQLYQINLDCKKNDFSGDFILSKSEAHKPLFSPDLQKQKSFDPTHESDISVTSPENKVDCQFKMIFTNQNHSIRNSNSTNARSSEEPVKELLANMPGKENLRLMDLGFNKAKVLRNNFTFEVPDSAACGTEETKGEKTRSQRESNVRNTEPEIDPFKSQKNESEDKNSKSKDGKEKKVEKVVYICSIEQELSSEKKSYVIEGKNQEIVIKEREGAKQKRDIYKQIFWRGSAEKEKGNLKNLRQICETLESGKIKKNGQSSEIESRFEWTYDKKDGHEGQKIEIEMDLSMGSQVDRNREQFARDLISAEKPRKRPLINEEEDLFAAKRATLMNIPKPSQGKPPQRRKTRRPDSLDDSQNNNFLLIRKASLNSQAKRSTKKNSRSNSFSKGDNVKDSVSSQSKGAISITNSIGADDRFSPGKFTNRSKKLSSGKSKQAEVFFQKKRESFGKRQSFNDLNKRRASLTNEAETLKQDARPEFPDRVSEISLDGRQQIDSKIGGNMPRGNQTAQNQAEIKRRERSQSQSGCSLSRNPAVLIINKTPNLMENFSFNYTEMNYSRCSSKLSNQPQVKSGSLSNPFKPKVFSGQPSLQIEVNNTSPSSSCRTRRSNPSFSGDAPNQRSKFMTEGPREPIHSNMPNINNFQALKVDNMSSNNALKEKPGYEPRTSAFTRSGEERDSRTIEESFVDFAKTTQNSKNNVFKEHSDGFSDVNHGQRPGRRRLGFASRESLEESSIVESEVIDLQNSMDIQSNYGNLLPMREDFKQLPAISSVADLKSDKAGKQIFMNMQNQIGAFSPSDNQQKRIAYTRNNNNNNDDVNCSHPKTKQNIKIEQQKAARSEQHYKPNIASKILQDKRTNLDFKFPNLENKQNPSNTQPMRVPKQNPGPAKPKKMTLMPAQQNPSFLKQKETSLCTLYTNSHTPTPQIHYNNTFDQNDIYSLSRNEVYRRPQHDLTAESPDSKERDHAVRHELSLQTNYNYERRNALSGLSIVPSQILVFQPKRQPQRSLLGLLRKKQNAHERRNIAESQTSIYGNSFQQKDAKTSFYKHSPVLPRGQKHASIISLPPFPLKVRLTRYRVLIAAGTVFTFRNRRGI